MLGKYFFILPLFFFLSFSVNAETSGEKNAPMHEGTFVVEIHHCSTCGFRAKADALAEDIDKELGLKAELIIGDVGSFDVYINDELIFSKAKAGRFPTSDEIIQKIKEYINNQETSSTQKVQ